MMKNIDHDPLIEISEDDIAKPIPKTFLGEMPLTDDHSTRVREDFLLKISMKQIEALTHFNASDFKIPECDIRYFDEDQMAEEFKEIDPDEYFIATPDDYYIEDIYSSPDAQMPYVNWYERLKTSFVLFVVRWHNARLATPGAINTHYLTKELPDIVKFTSYNYDAIKNQHIEIKERPVAKKKLNWRLKLKNGYFLFGKRYYGWFSKIYWQVRKKRILNLRYIKKIELYLFNKIQPAAKQMSIDYVKNNLRFTYAERKIRMKV